jgi:hypothetical protein
MESSGPGGQFRKEAHALTGNHAIQFYSVVNQLSATAGVVKVEAPFDLPNRAVKPLASAGESSHNVRKARKGSRIRIW